MDNSTSYYRLGSSSCAGEGDRAWNDLARRRSDRGTNDEGGKGGDRPVVLLQSPGDRRIDPGMGTPCVSGEKPSLLSSVWRIWAFVLTSRRRACRSCCS